MSDQNKQEENFGANSWFVDYLYDQYKTTPNDIPEQWQSFFGTPENGNGTKAPVSANQPKNGKLLPAIQTGNGDEIKPLTGGAVKIIDNMEYSLSIPTATSQRVIPVKLLEENRIVANEYLTRMGKGKLSFTHIIGWAIVCGLKKFSSLNNAFTTVEGKPFLVKRGGINLGIAIDIEKKDGTRSLMVPNIKNAQNLSFAEYWNYYEGIVKRARSNSIDPSEFGGTTVTLTNPGTIGTVGSIPRLMIGQGTIIAAGAIQYPAEFSAVSQDTITSLGISKVITLTSTYDHRIIQGAESGMFLQEVHNLLLGKNNFYEDIFASLEVPYKAVIWEKDNETKEGAGALSNLDQIEKQARVLQLINMYRVRGHLSSNLDPLGSKIVYHPELDPGFHNLTLWDLDRTFITGGFGGIRAATLREILNRLRRTYCETIGVEFMHIQNHLEKTWLQQKMEAVQNTADFTKEEKKRILEKLIQAEEFEHFIHNKFVGHKRFSLEGSETVIPVLDFLLNEASVDSVEEIVLGMAHRGRLNVLANIIGKNTETIFSEFEDITASNTIAGSGDVKYHLGANGKYTCLSGLEIDVSIAPNPSHLEWVDPVVEGIVRAKQARRGDLTEHRNTIAVLLHGDSAFAGQGVVSETLNLSQLKGYRTGGTIHIIINNQIGFTTTAEDNRSTQYCTDVAKMVQAPIFHVNGDDPEAALLTVKLAYEYRQKFHKDVVIDVWGYRRHGHNEGDEPGFTQPLMYERIKAMKSIRTKYTEKLVKNNVISAVDAETLTNDFTRKLTNALEKVKKKKYDFKVDLPLAVSKQKIKSAKHSEKTAITEKQLTEIIHTLTTVPEGFTPHPKLKKFLEKRAELLIEGGYADWALGEAVAFGSLLMEGTPVRLSGQDSVRGTFSQRHLALTDLNSGEEYFPLSNIQTTNAGKLEALDSSLSEAAVLGFEYGFSTADPLSLVIWEAQFGDFANGAQIIIDNFIVASAEKWQTPTNVVLLLPHGFEGQGPEHSSARLERFLTLCAQENMEVCNPSTPAQYFHLLRRHVRKGIQRPLIIMAPKSLLRLPDARSLKADFLNGSFQELMDDTMTAKATARKVILTSGKVYYELKKYREANKCNDVAVLRLEQYYPYESSLIRETLQQYKKAKTVVWVQEEPGNMGAWNFLRHRLIDDLNDGQRLVYSGRPDSASPAVGSSKLSNQQQETLIREAFE